MFCRLVRMAFVNRNNLNSIIYLLHTVCHLMNPKRSTLSLQKITLFLSDYFIKPLSWPPLAIHSSFSRCTISFSWSGVETDVSYENEIYFQPLFTLGSGVLPLEAGFAEMRSFFGLQLVVLCHLQVTHLGLVLHHWLAVASLYRVTSCSCVEPSGPDSRSPMTRIVLWRPCWFFWHWDKASTGQVHHSCLPQSFFYMSFFVITDSY